MPRHILPAMLAILSSPLAAQVPGPLPAVTVSSWTTMDGLPQSAINGLATDRDGYLWIASGAGVSRFDGDSFVTYPRDAARVASLGARVMATAPDGAIWVAHEDSMMRRLDSAGELVAAASMAPSQASTLVAGNGDSLWISQAGRAFTFDGHAWRELAALQDQPVGRINAAVRDPGGVLWFGGKRGLLRLAPDGGALTVKNLPCPSVRALSLAGDGGVWAGTCNGIARISADGQVQALAIDSRPTTVTTLLARGDSILWMGDSTGIRRFTIQRTAPAHWTLRTTFTSPLDLGGARPTVMIPWGGAGIWIGTDGAGLRGIQALPVGRITRADRLPDRAVHHIAPDGAGGVWISGGCGGLVRWHRDALAVYHAPSFGLRDDCIRGLMRDRAGRLWLGESGRLSVVDSAGTHREILTATADERNADIVPILEDADGRIWFGSGAGRAGFVAPDLTPTWLPVGTLRPHKVWSIAQDADGDIWIGQDGEVRHLVDQRVVQSFTTADGIPEGPIRVLQFDPDGVLWVGGYGGGLARGTGGHFRRLPPGSRRFAQAVSAMAIDRADRVWLLGDGGLTVAPRSAIMGAIDSQHPLRSPVELTLKDGVPEGNGGFPNLWLDPEASRLWAATVDGVVTVDVARFPFDTIIPQPRIEDILVDGRSVGLADSVVVHHGSNALEIRFGAPLVNAGQGFRFRYQLLGHDRDWVESGTGRVARYADLEPGYYTFQLLGVGRYGADGGRPLQLQFRVEPAWWQTVAARVMFALLGALAVLTFWYWVTSRQRARTSALRREIVDRERAEALAAAAARDLAHVSRLATAGELATSIAHELNQPLAAVVGNAHAARRRISGEHDVALAALLDAIVAQSDRAADVIRTLRAFVLKQRVTEGVVSINHVTEMTLRLLRSELSARGIKVVVADDQLVPGKVEGDAVQLQQVLVNLLLNAADAIGALPQPRRQVTLRLGQDVDNSVCIAVTDAGPGLSPGMLGEVFEPFYTTKENGLGLGLSLSRSIVEAHGGHLWAESVPGERTTFHVRLPRHEPQ